MSLERVSKIDDASLPVESTAEKCSELMPNATEKSEGDDVAGKPMAKPSSSSHINRDSGRLVWCLLITSIVSSPFLFGFDLVVVGSVQPRIVQSLGELDKLPWISVAYALAAMSTTLLWGRLFSLFNIKYVFIIAVIIFEAGSVLSGAAPNMNALIVGRALSGLGAVGTYAGAMNTLAVVTTIQQRPLYISFITLAYGLSTIVAPIIGGAFADTKATWRWSFYINICISGIFAPGYVLLFPSKTLQPPNNADEQLSRIRSLDLLGNVLWAGGTTTGLMAISFGGALYEWHNARIIGLFTSSAFLWILFVIQQNRTILTASAIFPVIFLHSKEMCILFAQVAASTAVATVPIFLIPLYYQFARDSSAIAAGIHLLPLVILRSLFILLNGFLMRKFGYYMPWYLGGAILCLAGSAPFMIVKPETPSANIYGYCVLIGAGVGAFNQASFAVAQGRTEPHLVPQAIAFITCGQVVGSAVSLAVANSIFINQATRLISERLNNVSREIAQQTILEGSMNLKASTSAKERSIAVQAVVTALNHSNGAVVAASALAVVLAVFMKQDKLFQ